MQTWIIQINVGLSIYLQELSYFTYNTRYVIENYLCSEQIKYLMQWVFMGYAMHLDNNTGYDEAFME